MTAKEHVDKKTKTMFVERDRTHYARAYGDPERVRIEEPLAIDLELPTSYARDLLAALRRVLEAESDFESAQLVLDVPIRVHIQPIQVEQLVEQLAKVMESAR